MSFYIKARRDGTENMRSACSNGCHLCFYGYSFIVRQNPTLSCLHEGSFPIRFHPYSNRQDLQLVTSLTFVNKKAVGLMAQLSM